MSTTITHQITGSARPRRGRAVSTGSAFALAGALAALGIATAAPGTASAASSSGFEVNLTVPFVAPASAYVGPACVGRSATDPDRRCSPPQRLSGGAHELLVFAKSSGGAVDVLAKPMTSTLKSQHCPADADGGKVSDLSRVVTVEGHSNGASYHVAVNKQSVLGPVASSPSGLFHLSVPVCLYEHKTL